MINKGKKINYKEINKISKLPNNTVNKQNFVYENFIKSQNEGGGKIEFGQKSIMNNGFIETITQQNTNNDSSQGNNQGKESISRESRNEKLKEISLKVEKNIKSHNKEKILESVNKDKSKDTVSCFTKCGK